MENNNLPFDDYKAFCVEVYKEIGYDLQKSDSEEYKILSYMVWVAIDRSHAQHVIKLQEALEKFQSIILQFEQIGAGTRQGMMNSVKMLSDVLDESHNKLKGLQDEMKANIINDSLAALKNKADEVLTDALSKKGLTLNQQLQATIAQFGAASDEAVNSADSVARKVNSTLKKTLWGLFLLPLAGCFTAIILILMMQSLGVISLPVQVNLDPAEVMRLYR